MSFYLQNADCKAFGSRNDTARKTLVSRALAAVQGATDSLSIPVAPGSRRAEAHTGDAAGAFLRFSLWRDDIIEVEGRDRPGLLSALSAVLRDHDLEVLSAHIEGLGEKAIDAFYVRRQGQDACLPERLRRRVRADLVAALSDPTEMAA